MTVREIEAGDAVHQLGRRMLIDVRSEAETLTEGIQPSLRVDADGIAAVLRHRFPDTATPLLVFCATGVRSTKAALTLRDAGYTDVVTLRGGLKAWRAAGLPVGGVADSRYARQIALAEVGEAGQRQLLQGRVLVVGAGGLGSPAALYLAAAGVGRIGVVDFDTVSLDNLHRQIVHDNGSVGEAKTASAARHLRALNPDVEVVAINACVDAGNAAELVAGWSVVVNGCDNFAARYALNDACVAAGIPLVDAAIHRFDGEVTTVLPGVSACYRCRHPEPPGDAESCELIGVLGALPGILGALQAAEALKLILGIGRPLAGRVLHFDALDMRTTEFSVDRDPACAACSGEIRHSADRLKEPTSTAAIVLDIREQGAQPATLSRAEMSGEG